MSISEAILWPGTQVCKFMGVDPEADAGLIRSMFNMFFYLVVILFGMWVFMS